MRGVFGDGERDWARITQNAEDCRVEKRGTVSHGQDWEGKKEKEKGSEEGRTGKEYDFKPNARS